jgi:hypothetical protein
MFNVQQNRVMCKRSEDFFNLNFYVLGQWDCWIGWSGLIILHPFLWNTILASSFGLQVPNKKKAEYFCFLLLGGLSLYLSLRNLKLIKSTLTEINFQL